MKNTELMQHIVLRGIQGRLEDYFLMLIVQNEWKDASHSDEAMRNQFEARYMAEQLYAIGKGWA